jgi:hypothetical protein
MRFEIASPRTMLAAAAVAALTLAGRAETQQAGQTGYAQGTGIASRASATSTSVFPGGIRMTDEQMKAATTFTVRIENISQGNVLKSASGGEAPFAIAPGLWVVHTGGNPLFKPGKVQTGRGLEPLAEDGNPAVLAESEKTDTDVMMGGIYNVPAGASAPGPAGPGAAFEFTVTAPPGSRLSFAEMFGQSNDLFYGPGKEGIALFDGNGKPVSGDVTSEISLWDAGTEINQEPGFGPDQAPRQKASNTGASESKPVGALQDRYMYPSTKDVLRLTIAPAS